MATTRSSLTRELRNAGISQAAIDAVWPEWWSNDAERSLSATTELRYTVARRLGIEPSSLFEGPPKFAWRENAKFKNLGTASPGEQAILTSFGMALGRILIKATRPSQVESFSPLALRRAALEVYGIVNLPVLIEACWNLGIPVVKTNLFPLRQKKMQAMSVRFGGRYAILIGRTSHFPAWLAFVVAHELGHIFAGHVPDGAAVLEMDDPLKSKEPDDEEVEADRIAFTLLTGDPTFQVEVASDYNAPTLAHAATEHGAELRIDAGVLALAAGHATGRWPQTLNALKLIPGQHLEQEVGVGINWRAAELIVWDALSDESATYVHAVMGQ